MRSGVASRSRPSNRRCTGTVVATLVLISALAHGAAAEPFETSWRSYNVGTSVYPGNATPFERDLTALATADFDSDGSLDVAVATAEAAVPGDGQSGFAVLFNDGTGRLGNPVHTTVSTECSFDIVAADFDHDGDPDIAVSIATDSWEGQSVRLYRNDGTGAFTTFQSRTVTSGPIGLAAADFDADGNLDLAVASYNGLQPNGVISILRGDGAGGLSAPTPYVVYHRPFKLEAGDLNGDGRPDLAIAHEFQAVSILLNQGTGTFGTAEVHDALYPLQGGMYYPCVTLADTDHDGDLDVFYANTRSHQPAASIPNIVHLRNDGGVFQRTADIPLVPNSAGPTDLAAGDLNADGWPDLIGLDYSGRSGDGPRVVLNNGSGGFLPAVAYPAGQATFSVGLADLDADGDSDLLTGDGFSMAVTVHENPGTGVFPMPVRYEAGFVNILNDMGDVDGDGDLDVFTSTELLGAAGALLRNNGDGSFEPPDLYTHSTTYGRGAARAKLRDLDGDGDLDLLYNDAHTDHQNGYNFYTAKNDGTGTFGPIVEWVIGTCGCGDVGAFDLDEDGDLDVINCEELACGGAGANRLHISLNHGDGTFASPYTIQISTGPHALIGGDYNEDGHVDLVTSHWMPYGLRDFLNVHLGNGDGTFQEEVIYQTGQGPRFLVQDDFDRDGNADLATANSGMDNYGRETLTVLFGTGAGTFIGRTDYYAPYSPDLQGVGGLESGDIDGDGDADLMMTTVANGVALYFNDGSGSFTFDHRLGAFWDPWSPLHADFTGDGVADLAVITNEESAGIGTAVIVMRGTGSSPADVQVPEEPVSPFLSAISPVTPNPFRTFAQFDLRVPTTQAVRISVHDISGRTVETIHDGELEAGVRHAFVLDGGSLPRGVYFIRAQGRTFETSRKIVLTR